MDGIRFKSLNEEFSIDVKDNVIFNITNECINSKNKETGGILIGNYSNKNNVVINNMTGPPDDSKQSNYSFSRGIDGLTELLENKWDSGQYYVGEWHLHPNSYPQPSRIDDVQMKKLAHFKLLKCPEPILLIIGGSEDKGWELSVHVYTKDRRITLVKD